MSSDNPYAVQLAALVKASGGEPPSSYPSRLYFHITACGTIFLLSIVYLLFSYREHRNRGRQLKLVRLQRLRSGNLIVLNTLFIFVIFVALSSLVFILQKWWHLRIFVQKKAPYDLVVIGVQCWTGPLLSGACFIYSNAAAALSMNRGGAGFQGTSRGLIALHNASLIGVLIFYFATTVPISLAANKAENGVIDAALSLIVGLGAASQIPDPANVPSELNAAIAQAASDMQTRNAQYYKLFRALVGVTTSPTIFLGLVAVSSLTFVLKIRKQAKWHASRVSNSVFVSVEQRTVAESPEGIVDTVTTNPQGLTAARPITQNFGPPLTPSFVTRGEAAKKAQGKILSQQEKDIVALGRLARDLSVSTPLMLLLIAFNVSCGLIGVIRIDRPHSWGEIELLLDGFSYFWEVVHLCILIGFIYNLTHNPYEHAQWSSHQASQSGAVSNNVLSIQIPSYPAPLGDGLSDIELNSVEKTSAALDEKRFDNDRM